MCIGSDNAAVKGLKGNCSVKKTFFSSSIDRVCDSDAKDIQAFEK